jgi:hypothetical protein
VKRLQEITICLAVGLVLGTNANGNEALATVNPYASIALRNVFDLNPPAAAVVTATPDKAQSKITLNGIISIFGRLQALFKVNGIEQSGQPSKEGAYMLDENESEDGVMVLHIDAQAETVTFNNHGIVQEIPLASAPAGAAQRLAMNERVEMPAVTVPKSYPSEFIRARTPEYLGGGPSPTTNAEPIANTSLEQRIILIEAQRAYLKSRNDPAADELPPTALTPTDGEAPRGS